MRKKWLHKWPENCVKGFYVVSFLFHNTSIQKAPRPRSEAHFPAKCFSVQGMKSLRWQGHEITVTSHNRWTPELQMPFKNNNNNNKKIEKWSSYLEWISWNPGTATSREVWSLTHLSKMHTYHTRWHHATLSYSSAPGERLQLYCDTCTVAGQEVM